SQRSGERGLSRRSFSEGGHFPLATSTPRASTRHNNGEVPHTAKWTPWRIKTYIAFSDRAQAKAFEHYLKSASGVLSSKSLSRSDLIALSASPGRPGK